MDGRTNGGQLNCSVVRPERHASHAAVYIGRQPGENGSAVVQYCRDGVQDRLQRMHMARSHAAQCPVSVWGPGAPSMEWKLETEALGRSRRAFNFHRGNVAMSFRGSATTSTTRVNMDAPWPHHPCPGPKDPITDCDETEITTTTAVLFCNSSFIEFPRPGHAHATPNTRLIPE